MDGLFMDMDGPFMDRLHKYLPFLCGNGLGNGQLLRGYGFVQNIAPPLHSRDRRIKMEQNKQTILF